ncbi:hypothetical protein AAHA92_15248 [Salvia divinorum]|uniref:Protein FAR1-RELATED SEQUENCE n=1 Tax=Salvia divinorum TaxID=28513 RepID=A0ABD1HGS2_SALDI
MEFETEAEAYDVYMNYAKATGFGTRKMTAHKDPITALLYDETVETFEWLFDAFEDAMMGKRPKTILTDQDQAMSAVLASKWPSTYHRLCVWHIFQNVAIHLSSVFRASRTHLQLILVVVCTTLKKNQNFLMHGTKYIITTQRSECMNAVVKHYVNYKKNIVKVFHHFQRLIDDRREKESIEDFKNAQSSPVMTFPLEILKHTAIVYTHKMFALFSEELRKAFESKIEIVGSFNSQLAVKAAESEDSYAFAIDGLLKIGNDIDGMAGKANNVTVEINKVGNISTDGDVNENQIKVVKPKGSVTYQTSKRPKNTLEHPINRKRKPKATKSGLEHTSSTQESGGTSLINDEYWNLTYTAFDHQSTP